MKDVGTAAVDLKSFTRTRTRPEHVTSTLAFFEQRVNERLHGVLPMPEPSILLTESYPRLRRPQNAAR